MKLKILSNRNIHLDHQTSQKKTTTTFTKILSNIVNGKNKTSTYNGEEEGNIFLSCSLHYFIYIYIYFILLFYLSKIKKNIKDVHVERKDKVL